MHYCLILSSEYWNIITIKFLYDVFPYSLLSPSKIRVWGLALLGVGAKNHDIGVATTLAPCFRPQASKDVLRHSRGICIYVCACMYVNIYIYG